MPPVAFMMLCSSIWGGGAHAISAAFLNLGHSVLTPEPLLSQNWTQTCFPQACSEVPAECPCPVLSPP